MRMFNLDEEYTKYLGFIDCKEESMGEIQRSETKKAFMGGCGQMLLLFRDQIAALPESEAIAQMQDLFNQAKEFWMKEVKKHNENSK